MASLISSLEWKAENDTLFSISLNYEVLWFRRTRLELHVSFASVDSKYSLLQNFIKFLLELKV